MSTMNPLKFVGGLVLEIGAVIAVLAILPGMGSSEPSGLSSLSSAPLQSNQVYFDAKSSRVLGASEQRVAPPAAWQNDFAAAPPVNQQRYVEEMLDHNSQRALDAAARVWNQGDRLLPPELRVRREAAESAGAPQRSVYDEPNRFDHQSAEPIRPITPRNAARPRDLLAAPNEGGSNPYAGAEFNPRQNVPLPTPAPQLGSYIPPPAPRDLARPSHYAPAGQRYGLQDQPRRLDNRY